MSEIITHNQMVQTVKALISPEGLEAFCHRAQIEPSDLVACLSGERYFSARLIAGVASARKVDLSGQWLRYAGWLYIRAIQRRVNMAEAAQAEEQRKALDSGAQEVARQMIEAAPHLPPHLIIPDVVKQTGLRRPVVEALICAIRQRPSGDYAYG